MRVDAEFCDGNLEGLEERNIKILDDWITKFNDKYPVVGKVRYLKSCAIESLTGDRRIERYQLSLKTASLTNFLVDPFVVTFVMGCI